MRSMAAAISTPIDSLISSPICLAKAGEPVTVTLTPGGASDKLMRDSMLSRTWFRVSLETPGARVTTLIVIMLEGRYRERSSGGTCSFAMTISASDAGSAPPFTCFTMSVMPWVPATYSSRSISDCSRSIYARTSVSRTLSHSKSTIIDSDLNVSRYLSSRAPRGVLLSM